MREPLRIRPTVIAVLALAVAVLVTFARVHYVGALFDQRWFSKYVHFADLLLRGEVPRQRLADLSTGYLWMIVVLRKAEFDYAAIRALQIAMVTLAAAAIGLAAARIHSRVAGVAAAVLLLGSRAALTNATELEPETLILFCSALALLFFSGTLSGGSKRWELPACGLALGVWAVARPAALLVAFALLAGLLSATAPVRQRLRNAAALAAGCALPILAGAAVNLALTGGLLFMNPGTVFFEGMNPYAAGYAGVQPRIVTDLDPKVAEPDPIHVTYRMVASRAVGRPLDRVEANRYWTGKALAFARSYPAAAARLLLRKAWLAANSHESWDLFSLVGRDREMAAAPWWIPFGLLLPLACAGAVFLGRRSVPLVLFGLAASSVLVLFYVTSRQRNAVLPLLALLGGVAAARVAETVRERRWKEAVATVLLVLFGAVLSLPVRTAQREDDYRWTSSFASGGLLKLAREAHAGGDDRKARLLVTQAATWLTASPPGAEPATLSRVVMEDLRSETVPQRRFDLALALARAGAWRESDAVLDTLEAEDYRPARENRAPSSIAYHRSRASLRLGETGRAAELLERAEREAPGDADVLALRAAVDPRETVRCEALLVALHDPFTADLARAQALLDTGREAAAREIVNGLRTRFPEWRRPGKLLPAAPGR